MGTYVNNNVVTLGAEYDYDDAVREIGALLGVGPREDGMYRLADIVQAGSVNKWALCKPFRSPEYNFASDDARASARKKVGQSLDIPTPKRVAISSQHAYGYTYLGYLAYYAESVAGTPNWDYLKPRGMADNEPNRLRDFDGYRHNARQPFTTGISVIMRDGTMKPLTADGNTKAINYFEAEALRCYVQMANTNVDIALEDLLEGTGGTQFYFAVEKYDKTNTGIEAQYYTREPNSNYHASENITEVSKNNGFSSIDIPLVTSDINTTFDIVLGINKFTQASDTIPAKEGVGFIAPRSVGERPYRFSFALSNHPVLDFTPYLGYYLGAGATTFSSFSIPHTGSHHRSASDRIGVSLNIKQGGSAFYIIGANTGTKPNGTRYMFRLTSQQNGRTVVGTIVDSNITSEPSNKYTTINAGSGEQTVYLRFDNMLPNAGDQINFGILELSVDDGATWGTVDSGSSLGLYIEKI